METIVDYRKVDISRAERIVLKEVSFTLEKGEFCYLVGRVGSGKSSLMKSMYGEVSPTGGEKAEVMDFDILRLRRKQIPYLRRKTGIVFQDFQHPVYKQCSSETFIPGVSVIDMLFNCGVKETKRIFWENVKTMVLEWL